MVRYADSGAGATHRTERGAADGDFSGGTTGADQIENWKNNNPSHAKAGQRVINISRAEYMLSSVVLE